jgi:hypothetical protein
MKKAVIALTRMFQNPSKGFFTTTEPVKKITKQEILLAYKLRPNKSKTKHTVKVFDQGQYIQKTFLN